MSADAPNPPSDAEARAFATSFVAFLNWVHGAADGQDRNEVVALVRDFLGDRTSRSVVSRDWAPFEHVNLQTALNTWSAEPGRSVTVRGVTLPPHHGMVTLQQLVTGRAMSPVALSAPALVDLPNGPGTTLDCLKLALLLVTDARGSYLLYVMAPFEHENRLAVEVAGLDVGPAQEVLGELEELRRLLNVYRGQLLDISTNQMGGLSISFAHVPSTRREDVVLPDAVLARIERHAFGVAEHRDALRAAHQHLKRGLLLYGPPGTGKTHTTRYLVGRMDGYTRLMMTGRALHAIGAATDLARDLTPAVIVLEDVDLVAEDRSFGHGSNPVLFELLDAMDGAAGDADLLFVLTTNRADLLEPALAARPGRVDVAVEIALPDAGARRRLFALYGHAVRLELTEDEVSNVVERTEGVTASFLKELVRRAVLESLDEHPPLRSVSGAQVRRALDDLLDSTQSLTRTLLGVGGAAPPVGPSDGFRGAPQPGVHGGGGTAYRSRLVINP